MNNKTELKIGDFITGSYASYCIAGIIKKINKKTVVINVCQPKYYNDFYKTKEESNVTISKIREIKTNYNIVQ